MILVFLTKSNSSNTSN